MTIFKDYDFEEEEEGLSWILNIYITELERNRRILEQNTMQCNLL
jgi:hypothetical protein